MAALRKWVNISLCVEGKSGIGLYLRFCASTTNDAKNSFRSIPIDNNIYAYLEKNDLGTVPKTKGKFLMKAPPKELNPVVKAIFQQKMKLIRSTIKLETIPEPNIPEIAFCGRSNVGKSSLLNALIDNKKKDKAPVSNKPGKTQSLLFYSIEPWYEY